MITLFEDAKAIAPPEPPSPIIIEIFGTVNDKEIDNILKLLPKKPIYYFCEAKIDRAFNANKLKEKAVKFNLHGEAYYSVKEAYKNAISNSKKEDLIFIGGSTFVVAEVL